MGIIGAGNCGNRHPQVPARLEDQAIIEIARPLQKSLLITMV
jgi:hypothetical protein